MVSSDLGLNVGVRFFQAGKEHGMNKCIEKGMEPSMVYKWSKVKWKRRIHVRGEAGKEVGVGKENAEAHRANSAPTSRSVECDYSIFHMKKLRHSRKR